MANYPQAAQRRSVLAAVVVSGGGSSSGAIECEKPPRLALIEVTDAAGLTKTITYGENGTLSSVLDENGNGYYFEYLYYKETRKYYA